MKGMQGFLIFVVTLFFIPLFAEKPDSELKEYPIMLIMGEELPEEVIDKIYEERSQKENQQSKDDEPSAYHGKPVRHEVDIRHTNDIDLFRIPSWLGADLDSEDDGRTAAFGSKYDRI